MEVAPIAHLCVVCKPMTFVLCVDLESKVLFKVVEVKRIQAGNAMKESSLFFDVWRAAHPSLLLPLGAFQNLGAPFSKPAPLSTLPCIVANKILISRLFNKDIPFQDILQDV